MHRTFDILVTAGALAWLVGLGLPYAGTALALAEEPAALQAQESEALQAQEPAAQPAQESADAGAGEAADKAAADAAAMKERWGVEVVFLRRTAHGHMLDFRYRVLDAEKAAPLFKRQTKPRLIHGPTGKVLAVPETAKVGPLRNSNAPKEGRIYWMFFGNAGGLVKTGDKVTVAIGDFRAEDLTVQ